MGALDKIEHVVVLMLENRSFDSILGTLYGRAVWFCQNEFLVALL
jgi:phospholipase C